MIQAEERNNRLEERNNVLEQQVKDLQQRLAKVEPTNDSAAGK